MGRTEEEAGMKGGRTRGKGDQEAIQAWQGNPLRDKVGVPIKGVIFMDGRVHFGMSKFNEGRYYFSLSIPVLRYVNTPVHQITKFLG